MHEQLVRQSSSTSYLLSQHLHHIKHARLLQDGKLLITAGSEGQIHLYDHTDKQWKMVRSLSLFDCSVISIDSGHGLAYGKIVVSGYDNCVKIVRITTDRLLIVDSQLHIKWHAPIIVCRWCFPVENIVLGGANGMIGVAEIDCEDQWHITDKQIGEHPVYIATTPHTELILAAVGKRLVGVELVTTRKSKSQLKVIELFSLNEEAMGLLAQQKIGCSKHYSVVMLTKSNILFFQWLEDKFEMKQSLGYNGSMGQIGWGADQWTLCLYSMIDHKLKTSVYRQQLHESWQLLP